MEKKKLIMSYVTEIWDNGDIVTTPIFTSESFFEENKKMEETEDINYINLDILSQRISQVLGYIKLAYRYNQNTGVLYIEDSLKSALENTAKNFNVSMSSVTDKCTRQMKTEEGYLKMNQFKTLIRSYLIEGNYEIKALLLNNTSKKDEIRAIDLFFESPDIPFILHGKPY